MTTFISALWAEALKVRRSKVPLLTSIGFSFLPFVDGFFMIIVKDPTRAQNLGLIGAKARILTATADWPAFWQMLVQGSAIAGMFIFAIFASWIFGREFTDRTAKDLLALPTSRSKIISAKFVMIAAWGFSIVILVYVVSLIIGYLVVIPGWSMAAAGQVLGEMLIITGMNLALMTPVAFLASAGRGYLPPLGWVILTIFLAQVIATIGWGAWFPWAIPALYSGEAGSNSGGVGVHSVMIILLTFIIGLICTYSWWYRADHTR
jgi:ABC-2 type transport system permease protein